MGGKSIQELEVQELELQKRERGLDLRDLDIASREERINRGFEAAITTQEMLRRAIEVAANSLSKVKEDSSCEKVLNELLEKAVKKLSTEIEKLAK